MPIRRCLVEIGNIFNPSNLFVGLFIPNCITKYPGLTPNAKLLWGRLAQFAGKKDECWPSRETLADELGMSVHSIDRPIKELIAQGFVKKINPTGKDRLTHKTARYSFLWHEIFDELIPCSDNNSRLKCDNSGVRSTHNSGQRSTHNSIVKGSVVKGSVELSKDNISASQEAQHKKELKNHSLMDLWNKFPAIRRHKRPNTETYQRCIRYFKQLQKGTFLQDKVFDSQWLTDNNIPADKKYTRQEIIKGLRRISTLFLEGYWPKNKKGLPKSLPALMYNPKSRKSFFLQKMHGSEPKSFSEQLPKDNYPEVTAVIKPHVNITNGNASQLQRGIKTIAKVFDGIPKDPPHNTHVGRFYSPNKSSFDNPRLECFVKVYVGWLDEHYGADWDRPRGRFVIPVAFFDAGHKAFAAWIAYEEDVIGFKLW